jgi:hypothetical protein
VTNFGTQVPMKRLLADPLSSYVSGATIGVTGGKPIL